jgi:hypothetical protein
VILSVYKELAMAFVCQHVKSHQDNNMPVASLLLESRLNMEADQLATSYMKEDHTRRPTVALFPSANAQLIINKASVTQKLPQAILFKEGSTGIRKYLMTRNAWTKQTLDDIITWSNFVIATYPSDKRSIVGMINTLRHVTGVKLTPKPNNTSYNARLHQKLHGG